MELHGTSWNCKRNRVNRGSRNVHSKFVQAASDRLHETLSFAPFQSRNWQSFIEFHRVSLCFTCNLLKFAPWSAWITSLLRHSFSLRSPIVPDSPEERVYEILELCEQQRLCWEVQDPSAEFAGSQLLGLAWFIIVDLCDFFNLFLPFSTEVCSRWKSLVLLCFPWSMDAGQNCGAEEQERPRKLMPTIKNFPAQISNMITVNDVNLM